MSVNKSNADSNSLETLSESIFNYSFEDDSSYLRNENAITCPFEEYVLYRNEIDEKLHSKDYNEEIGHNTMDIDDNSIDSSSNSEKIPIDDFNISSRASSNSYNLDSDSQKNMSGNAFNEMDKVDKNLRNDELNLDYIRFIPNFEIVFAKSYDQEMNIAIGLIDEVLKMRDEWIDELTNNEFDDSIEYNYGNKQDGNNIEDINKIIESLPKKIDIKYEMINGVYKIKWYSNKNLLYNPITFKKIKKEEISSNDNEDNILENNPEEYLSVNKSLPLYETESKSIHEFIRCLRRIMSLVNSPIVKSFTYYRLKFLLQSYQLYTLFNGKFENEQTIKNIKTGFYNVYKVDTHVHHSACMSQKHLLKFIRKCYNSDKDCIVLYNKDNVGSTLGQVFNNVFGCEDQHKSIDHLNMDAIRNCFQRFDRFNEKYNPFGSSIIREIFLKYNNSIKGRYLANITKEVIQDLKMTHYQFVEWRISIYGKDKNEWNILSEWLYYNGLYCKHVRWIIQIPRLYYVLYKDNHVNSFSQMIDNIFSPLIEALRNPKKYPLIYILLSNIVGWDTVDDESQISRYSIDNSDFCYPENWKTGDNPPYSYWGFYLYSNIRVLNHLMLSRGLNPLKFRPHCGEAGKISHLATMYLLADSINHGILLKKTPVLQYLYYLKQIGISVSPVSNNALFLELMKNPFPKFFNVGLNVSLSTDDPLIFHLTDESLLEEYSIASHIWKFNNIDLCEIARNSVLQSGFSSKSKANWLGISNHKYLNKSPYTILTEFEPSHINDISKSNVPNIRIQFRSDMLKGEINLIRKNAASTNQIDNVINIVKNLQLKNNNDHKNDLQLNTRNSNRSFTREHNNENNNRQI